MRRDGRRRRDPNVQRLEQELAEKLGAKVAIQHAASGKGKVVVTYNSLDELDGILAHIITVTITATVNAPATGAARRARHPTSVKPPSRRACESV